MSLQRLLSGDTVTVETKTGASGYETAYSAPLNVDCRAEATRRLVRDASGAEVVSEVTVQLLPVLPDGRPTVDVFTPESRVSVLDRTSQIITAQAHRGMGAAVYVEVTVA